MLGRSKKRKPSRTNSLIGHQSRVDGDIRFGGGLHVDGQIKGNVASDGDDKATLTVSDRGAIEGEVRVPYIILHGAVLGDVYASEHVELASSARVRSVTRSSSTSFRSLRRASARRRSATSAIRERLVSSSA